MTDLEKLEELKKKYEEKCRDIEQARKGIDRLSNIAVFLSAVDEENYYRYVANDEKERADDPDYDEGLFNWGHDVESMKIRLEKHREAFEDELADYIKDRDSLLREYLQLAYRLGEKDKIADFVRPFEYGSSSADWIVDKVSPKAMKLVFEDDVFSNPVCPVCGRVE